MTVVTKSLDEMLTEIEFQRPARYDILVPEKLGHVGSFGRYLTGPVSGLSMRCAICTAIENAYFRGNKSENYLSITLKLFEGRKGIVYRIRDSGEGFDFDSVQAKFQEGEKYYQNIGVGFRNYNYHDIEASFEGNGNTVNIMSLVNYPRNEHASLIPHIFL